MVMYPWRRWGLTGLLVAISSSSVFGQQFSVGIVGGVPITSSVVTNPSGYAFSAAHTYLIGPTFEVGLPLGLSLEGDFLFHPFDIQVGAKNPPGFTANTTYNYHVFEIPVLVKARFTNGIVRPFVEGGPTFRGTINSFNISHYGVTFGGGFEIGRKRLLRISPAIRYTRWGAGGILNPDGYLGSGTNIAKVDANQLSAVVGITF